MVQPFDFLLQKAPLFFLVASRIFGLFLTVPLISTKAVSRAAKLSLAGFIAFLVMPSAYPDGMVIPPFTLHYVLLIVGEGLIGIITGFFVVIIFSTFSTAGQFFAYQTGFGASGVFDSLSQIENPLLGQYFNFLAVIVFLHVNGFQKLFFTGIFESFQKVNCFIFLEKQKILLPFFFKSLSVLFLNAIIIAFPVMGTLLLIHVTMGLLTKAAPQINLLSEGFPITILVSFFLLVVMLPFMINTFNSMLESGFGVFRELLIQAGNSL